MKLMNSYLKEVNLLLEKVISGTDLTPNMAQNVLDITLTDDLKKNVKNFLENNPDSYNSALIRVKEALGFSKNKHKETRDDSSPETPQA